MKRPSRKILTLEAMQTEREALRQAGKTLVQCHGCFDIVHPGHVRYLEFARDQGAALLVSISADEVVGKGVERPYIGERLRAENVAALEFVDYVVVDKGTWAGPILDAVKPDVYVKGKEYENNRDTRFAKERELVESYGGRVIFSSGDVVYSSTFVIGQFRDQWQLEQSRLSAYCSRHEVTHARLDDVFRRANKLKVLVVGDAVLDRYVHCESLGVAAESPMLSVQPVQDEFFVGAGGLIACQIGRFGTSAALLTSYGETGDSAQFGIRLRDSGVELIRSHTDDRPVYLKTRYLVDNKKVLKVDEGRRSPMSTRASRDFIALFDARLADFDAVVVTDFGYGLFSAEIIEGLLASAGRHQKPLFVDVSHRGFANLTRFKSPRLATPTEQELRLGFGDTESGLSSLAARYFEATKAERILLTLGKRGVILFEDKPDASGRLPTEYLPSLATNVIDEVGAGDVLLAGAVVADLAGASAALGAYLGSSLAALHIARMGNNAVNLSDLLAFLKTRPELV